ncbi:hypothetical protein EVAR_46450_1 [Eumeta japonica]|uniref:Uncharacterized protein n=1 Tax=Eumeta variegata TaxID=151549 RepID=A0A4C1XFA0_EUMVA|nr:hypothetical protein EVAR_46450_1 [Eumeta japonica]
MNVRDRPLLDEKPLDMSTELTRSNKSNCLNGEGEGEPGHEYGAPSAANKAANVLHFVTLATLGLLTLGIWWSAGGGGWQWGESALRLSGPPALGWAGGRVFQSAGLPPQLAPLLTGVLARHFGYLNMRHYTDVDYMLRPSIATIKGYPTDNALVGCYVLGKTLGHSADLKVKNETLFYTSAADLAYME